MMKQVAIVGGSGFIGHYLAQELLQNGYEVRIVDRVKPRLDLPFVEADIADLDALTAALQGVEGVFHLAALVGVDHCLSDDQAVINVNLKGTEHVLKACQANGIKRLLFSSSSEVYGDGVKVPFSEDDELHPKSTYGKTKILSEELLKQHASADLQVRVVRFFNIYGLGQRTDFVINRFVERIVSGQPVTIYGDGTQTRCFTHVTDAARGTVRAFEYGTEDFDVFNIANHRAFTILELAELIAKLSDKPLEVQHADFGQEGVRSADIEIFRRIPDTQKAKARFGFEAQVLLEDALREIIAHAARVVV